MAKEKQKVPTNVDTWKETAKKMNALGSIATLGSQKKLPSASKFEFRHFIGLRVIWTFVGRNPGSTLPPEVMDQIDKSRIDLAKSDFFTAYMAEMEEFGKAKTRAAQADRMVPEKLGSFINVWQLQRSILLGDEIRSDRKKISKVTMSPIAGHITAQKALKNAITATPTPAQKSGPLHIRMQQMSLKQTNVKMLSRGQPALGRFLQPLHGKTEEKMATAPDEDSDSQNDSDVSGGWDSEDGDEADDSQEEVAEGEIQELLSPVDIFTQVSSTPDLPTRGRKVKSEETVNCFLIAFLNALTAAKVPYHTRWSAVRNAFTFQKKVQFEARTDGHLHNKTGDIFGLIEVKPRPRKNETAIRVQESAQMAAWIDETGVKSHDFKKDCRIFLLSQDKDEIYVTFPYFTEDYGKEKRNFRDARNLQERDFLWMHEYGPFRLNSRTDTTQIATFLLAYTHLVSKRSSFAQREMDEYFPLSYNAILMALSRTPDGDPVVVAPSTS